jgi:hypothetical protein
MPRHSRRRRPSETLRTQALFEPLEFRRLLSGTDTFSAAPALAGIPLSTTGSNAAATPEPGEPAHAGYVADHSVWWNWTATTAGPVTIDTFGSNFDTLLAVYTGNAVDALTPVASNDQAGNTDQSRVSFFAVASATYHIAVDGWSGQTGDISLNVSGPSNDQFISATPLDADADSASNVNATAEPGEPAHAGQPAQTSVWWRWTSPVTGDVTIDTLGSSFDTRLAVYTGPTVSTLIEIAANDDAAPGTTHSSLTLAVSAGATYHIAVDGWNGATGDVQLHLTGLPTPANDDFADATPLTGTSAAATGTNVGATTETDEPTHQTGAAHSVWWTWTAPASGPVIAHTSGSNFDTVLAVYTGDTLPSLSPVASNDDAGLGYASLVDFDAVAGTTYRFAVAGYSADDVGDISLSVAPFLDITATPGPDTIRVTHGPSPDTALVFINNNTPTPDHTVPLSSVGRLRVLGGQGDDTLTVDFTNGNPLPGGGLSFDGAAGADAIQLLSTGGSLEVHGDTIEHNEYGIHLLDVESRSASAGPLTFAYVYSGTIHLSSNSPFSNDPANLDLYAEGGTVFLDGPTNLRGLELAYDALVIVAPGGSNLMRTREFDLFDAATLDLNDNPVIIDHDPVPLGDIVPDLQTGYAAGAWNGIGIRSSTAAASPGRAIAYIDNSVLGLSSFAGIPIDPTTRLLQYTHTGDANFDGRITPDDFALADRGLLRGGTAWWQGDFNYDAQVTPADLQLLLPTPPAPAPALTAVLTATPAIAAATATTTPTPTITTTSVLPPSAAPTPATPANTYSAPTEPTPRPAKTKPAPKAKPKKNAKPQTPAKKPAPKPHKKPKATPAPAKSRAPHPPALTLFSTTPIRHH